MTLPGAKQKPTTARAPTEADRRMGERIAILRREQGLSQTELGNACGITFQQVQKYENGHNRISGSRLLQIAKLLKVEPAYLLDGTDRVARPRVTVIERMLADHFGHKLAQAFLSIEDRQAAGELALFVQGYADGLVRAKKAKR